MKEFKVLDKVYYPMHDTKVHIVEQRDDDGDLYPLRVCGVVFSTSGTTLFSKTTPLIFHANEENHALLEKLYGVEFEKPPTKPTSRDIIQALLNSGQKYVPCYVSSGIVAPNGGSYLDFIVCVHNDGRFYNQLGEGWKYATPFDPRTGQPITEMPE